MNKGICVKRIISLVMIFLLSINNLAAVVSENDKSAFMTKAEFDAIKNAFQSEMDQYNASIDSKIDGAISSYLAGIKVEKEQTTSFAYFDVCDESTQYIKMRNYNDYPFNTGNPDLNAVHMQASDYYGPSNSIWGHSAHVIINYTGNTTASRVFVDYQDGKYFYNCYATALKESFKFNSWKNYTNTDTYAGNHVYPFGTDKLKSDEVYQGNWWNTWWHVDCGDPSGGYSMNWSYKSVALESEYNNYTRNYLDDLVYEDYPTAQQTNNYVKFFETSNINNNWFAGSTATYLNAFNSATITGRQSRFSSGSLAIDTSYTKNTSKSVAGIVVGGITSTDFRNMNLLSRGYEPALTKWADIYVNDTRNFGNSFQYYSMIDGMPIVYCESTKKYKWKVNLDNNTDTCYVYLKIGRFNGAPNEDECITLANGQKKYEIIGGSGVIEWEMGSNEGMVFAKWTKGFGIKKEADTLTIISE